MKKLLIIFFIMVLQGCAATSELEKLITGDQFDDPVVDTSPLLKKEENHLEPPQGGPIPIAVYGFTDKTGQRKSVPNIASLSSAITQGAENYLIKALKEVGDNRWFIVLERVGLENLVKERQMIRQTREQFQGKDATQLPAMTFAGIIAEGAVVGYDSNTVTGGAGVRIFGIGGETQYQSDTVTVSLRVVSVTSGEILTSVVVTKTVLSYMDKVGVLRMFSSDTKALETEIGGSINESINKATNKAIQAAVIETIKEGAKKGHWAYKEQPKELKNETNTSSTATQQ